MRPSFQSAKATKGSMCRPNGRELWTANAQDGTLSVIDLATRTVAATLDAKRSAQIG